MEELQSVHFFLNGSEVGSMPVFRFMRASNKYRTIYRDIGWRVVVESPVEPNSVAEFVKGINHEPSNVNEGNVLDLLCLCEEWKAGGRIKKLIRAFFERESTTPNTVLHLYSTSVEKGLEIGTFLEEKIHGCFLSLCQRRNYKQLQDLGIQALLRIFAVNDRSLVREHVHEVFDFVMSCFCNKRIGPLASALLLGVTFSELSPEERVRLLAEERMDFQMLNREQAVERVDIESRISRNHMLSLDIIKELKDRLDEAYGRLDQLQRQNEALERQVSEMAKVKVECACHDDMGLQVSCKTCHRTMQFHPDRQVEEYVFSESLGPFNGIMNWLQLRFRKSLEKMVTVTTSSQSLFYGGQPICVLEGSDQWCSDDKPNSYIQFLLLNQRVRISAYTIVGDAMWNCQLRSWKLRVSNDGEKWTTIDARDTDDLMTRGSFRTYKCTGRKADDQYYRYIRLIQTGPNAEGSNYLIIRRFEIFGALETIDKSAICLNPVCSYAFHDKTMITQKWFHCRTCGLTAEKHLGCCEACAYSCHRGHDVYFAGSTECYCDCGDNRAPNPCQCLPRHGCTFFVTNQTAMRQQMFFCHTCALEGDRKVCAQCAMTCHKDHKLESAGLVKGWCHCGNGPIFKKGQNCMLRQGRDPSTVELLL